MKPLLIKYFAALRIAILTVSIMALGILCVMFKRIEWLQMLVRYWGDRIMKILRVTYDVINPQNSRLTNVIYIVNHTSLLDTFIYPAVLPLNTQYVSKIELEKLGPFTWLGRKLGYIFLDRKNPVGAVRELRDMAVNRPTDTPIFIHPEGTRSITGEILPFKSGLYLLLKNTQCDVVPVVSLDGEKLWPKSQFISNRGHLKVAFGDPIKFDMLKDLTKDQAADYLRQKMRELQMSLVANADQSLQLGHDKTT